MFECVKSQPARLTDLGEVKDDNEFLSVFNTYRIDSIDVSPRFNVYTSPFSIKRFLNEKT